MEFPQHKICAICKRTPKVTTKRSHSLRSSQRIQYLNLQRTTFKNKRVYACSKCLKTQLKKAK